VLKEALEIKKNVFEEQANEMAEKKGNGDGIGKEKFWTKFKIGEKTGGVDAAKSE